MDKIDEYINKHPKWINELLLLRSILVETELEENIKWGAPVYSLGGKNVLGFSAFKNHFGLWFFQGVFLEDKHKLLVNAQEGKTKALRQMRFDSSTEIDKPMVKAYIIEAIDNQKAGRSVKIDRSPIKVEIPNELVEQFKNDSRLKEAFNKLSPGKQKEYANHISEAKREATKLSRIEKITPLIKEGVGLHDKYKNC